MLIQSIKLQLSSVSMSSFREMMKSVPLEVVDIIEDYLQEFERCQKSLDDIKHYSKAIYITTTVIIEEHKDLLHLREAELLRRAAVIAYDEAIQDYYTVNLSFLDHLILRKLQIRVRERYPIQAFNEMDLRLANTDIMLYHTYISNYAHLQDMKQYASNDPLSG